jgi:iron complex outermembrane receptor protein
MNSSLHLKPARVRHWGLVMAWWIPLLVYGQTVQNQVDLTELSLEELMNIRVTLASRKPEKMSETAAAVYVLTKEDIRRAGVTSIPDALRLVPGVMVGRIDANKWAISSRGFMDLFSNKQLVLIDGRSVYSPIFSGVLWEAQDVFLPDIDRIEVIRGPGSSLWGANAVNGIINIVTQKAKETQGASATMGGGTEEKGFGGFRFGGMNRSGFAYRVYAKYFNRGVSVYEDGSRAADGWSVIRGGFRMDWDSPKGRSFTLQGDAYTGQVGSTVQIPVFQFRGIGYNSPISGGNLLGRLTRTFSATSEIVLQFYVDRVARKDTVTIGGSYNTADFDFQHRFKPGRRHDVVWGLGYRHTADRIDENAFIHFNPWRRQYGVASAFIQDEISLMQNRLRLMAGSKFEHNDFSGFEFQPSLRLLWKIGEGHSFWAAVSRAVRTPSRTDEDIDFILVKGNRDLLSEKLNAYECGWHLQASDRLYLDVSAYANQYRHLRSLEPIVFENKLSSRTTGLEVAADWSPFDWWRFRLGYTRCAIRVSLDPGSVNYEARNIEGESPSRQFTMHSTVELADRIEFDVSGRYVDKLASPSLNHIPSYFELDSRIGFTPVDGLEFSLVARNWLQHSHSEFTANWIVFAPTCVPRSVYGSVSLIF